MIKKIYRCIATVIVLICCILASDNDNKNNSPIISFFITDIDNDDKLELLTIETLDKTQLTDTGERYGNLLCIYKEYDFDKKTQKLTVDNPVYSFDLSYVNPMLVQAGDINGDGIKEISVVAYKTTKFHPVLAKRPFFYALSEKKLVKVWLGSRLSRPFDDFLLYDFDNDNIDEIISIEKTQDNQQIACVYDWAGFGFDMSLESASFDENIYFENDRYKEHNKIIIHTPIGSMNIKEIIKNEESEK